MPEFATQTLRLHVVDERALAVDLDDREPFAVARFELRVVGDVDLFVRDAFRIQDAARALAEMAAARGVEQNARR